MRVSFTAVYAWLDAHADTCNIEQLNALEELIEKAKQKVRERHQHGQAALAKADAAARASGYESLEALLRDTNPELARAFVNFSPNAGGGIQTRGATRKPYLDPLLGDRLYAAFKNRIPPELQPWLDKGWDLSELHFRRIAAARSVRGLGHPYDPVARHAELKAIEDAKLNRIRREKK